MPNAEANCFNYDEAFSRNIGWVTADEQRRLGSFRVAIAGLGGVGGSHLLTLARLGIGGFTIADFDSFDWPNLNRQAGAMASTMGCAKLDVMADTVRDINPTVDLRLFPEGVTNDNLDAFLAGADLYLDSLDLFALDIRRRVFAHCRELGIPAVTAAPMGMGTSVLVFTPDSMSFEDYFAFGDLSPEDQLLKFIVGVSPTMLQRHYLLNRGSFDPFTRKAPSTAMGIELAAGVACTTALKLLLDRGQVRKAPCGLHFDAYRNELVKTWRPLGNRNPLQLAMFHYVRHLLRKSQADATHPAGTR
jgi:molybdopterin/thiamine biosynthesis adenylyltransferase